MEPGAGRGCHFGPLLFPFDLPPRPENFDFRAFTVTRLDDSADFHWRLRLQNADLGEAEVGCLRNPPPFPSILIEQDARLSPAERAQALKGRSQVTAQLKVEGERPLRERKRLLELLRLLMAYDGSVALDHISQALWSKASLEEECSHCADLDILALFTVHAVAEPGHPSPWMHTHGLQELGFSDFDLLDPNPDICRIWDLVRALAFAVVEGALKAGGPSLSLVQGAPPVRLVESSEFRARAAEKFLAWKELLDEDHVTGHAIVCDPPPRGLRALFSNRPRPWTFLSRSFDDTTVIAFSSGASDLMSQRARETWPLLRSIREEFEDLSFPTLVKVRYDGPSMPEHLWFEVNALEADSVEATLVNEPWQELGISCGDRRLRKLEQVSDWMFLTPAGPITPLRTLRERRPELEAALQAPRKQD